MVLRRATLSAGASVVPIPGIDLAADVGLLLQLLPAISRKFGLSPEQIRRLDPQQKAAIYALIRKTGKSFVGKVITKKLIVAALKRVGIQMTAKQVAKYVPIAGQIAAALLGFGAMMYIGTSHLDECHEIANAALGDRENK
jgi:hypothetical protein